MALGTPANERKGLRRAVGGAPLYASLASLLEQDIRDGRFKPGSTLPSEKELTERHGVSRQTVRQALRMLRDQGLISSHPGIGTIVRQPAPQQDLFTAVNSTEQLLQFVGNTEMHRVSTQEVVLSRELASLIECRPGLHLSEVTFLRRTPGTPLPMSFVRIYVPLRFAPAQDTPQVISSPIYQNIERMFGVRVEEIRQDVTATVLDDELADVLQAKVGEAALQITRFYYDANQQMVQVTISYYPSSRYRQSARFRATAQG